MKKDRYIIITAGRGPIECSLAVHGVQMRFRKFLEEQEIKYEIVKQQRGAVNNSMVTIVFRIELSDYSLIISWVGTIQWISRSPIRKFSKRKNWFIKCCVMDLPESGSINLKDLIVQAFKASGPGGQHRNKVETAIRIIHKPTGIIVTASDSKSKAQNKKRAMEKLEARLDQLNRKVQSDYDTEEWTSKIEIQRGNPSKVFYGTKFTEV